MSLKSFHLLFIIVCILLSMMVGGWGLLAWQRDGDGSSLVLGILFLILAPCLFYYGLRFRRDWSKKGLPL